ncbi:MULTISPECIES: hypothetical protein [Geobacter]|uniref:hypothetical protein n=1 Tax=Geobacter TaxID=28231 RepID=UPI000DBB21C7|nr:hypothetical protein [Geobacter sulfurreducens]BBA70167.1 hypothetical protein YM18_1634 [Geobacter sulfurreducens]BEH10353.1 hypothetical protein GSUET_19650 [Geobacter sulfurreducens subsp. ethanolicus]BET58060.1 hypothetical protein GEO60473_11000 [Geobacter sp. 60473]HML78314.1 hypothetical protein [Geobacter sulfurreducens]
MLLEDVGNDVYKTWSNTKRRDEIAKLVQGYRSGLPAFILCRMTEAIAGSRKRARKFLHEMMPPAERQEAVTRESGPMAEFVKDCLL